MMLEEATSTQRLACDLTRIVQEMPDYRSRVDAISDALGRHRDITARTALVIALASVGQNYISNEG